MQFENLKVLPLHKYPNFLTECCDLINDEWPRSKTARMMSLQASCDNLPTSLILLDEKHLLGHCKLTPIPSIPNSCFIEAVVIKKCMRGKKLGTHLMKSVEEYCKKLLKLEMLHLSTKGQEQFYVKLGYKVCPPISIYGTTLQNSSSSLPSNDKNLTRPNSIINNAAPTPPPLPKPQPNYNSTSKSNKTYMCKYLI